MKRLILISFSDPTNTWYSSRYREFIKYFLERIRKRFGITQELEIVVKYIELAPDIEPAHVIGNFFRDRNPEIAGVFVQAHSSIEVNKKILFLAEIMKDDDHLVEVFFFENRNTFLLKSVFKGKMEGEEL